MNCTCVTWCRVPDAEPNTQGGKIPPSDHHPDCPAYKAEPFVVIELDGSFCVMPFNGLEYFFDGCDFDGETTYSITPIMLAPDQVEKMPEFEGF